jgi:Tripartite tricarboxylate transporter family receptor
MRISTGESQNVHNRARLVIDRCLSICCHALAGLALAALGATTPQAAEWPTRAVTVVVPYAAGGNTDIMARMASQKLAEAFGQSFIVDNRVGAGGALAASYVAQAAPDGYTLFFAASPILAVLPKVQKVSYDAHKDFTPVSVFGTGPFVLAISSAIPAHTIPEFVAYGARRAVRAPQGRRASACPHERHHIGAGRAPLDNGQDVRRPRLKRGTLLARPVMTLIDARDASAGATDVVQYCLGDFEAETCTTGNETS